MLLSYGYKLDDYTLCKEIKKLLPGHYIIYKEGNISINQFYSLPSEYDQNISGTEAIEKIDSLFRNAIQLQFEKDREYNYKHLVALSGGLDSRMTTWVAHDMCYTNQLNFNFSQSGYLDETIAKEISADLKHEWIFKALDNGLFLTEIDEINNYTGGNVIYFTLAHGNSVLKYLNFEHLGIKHTGQVGGILKGYYRKNDKVIGKGEYSEKLLNKVDRKIFKNFKTESEFQLLNRQFNGTLFGDVNTQRYTEALSPFLNIAVINFGLTASVFEKKNQLMREWILKKYPQAGDYIWESTKAKLTDKHIRIKNRELPLKRIPYLVLKKLGLTKLSIKTSSHMNPLDYWYKTNPEIKDFQDEYFSKYIDLLEGDHELKKDAIMLYNKGSAGEKNQVLTLLSALKLFFK